MTLDDLYGPGCFACDYTGRNWYGAKCWTCGHATRADVDAVDALVRALRVLCL